jgi:hypothetical protein
LPDVTVSTNTSPGSLYLYLGNGRGGFAPPRIFAAPNWPKAIEAADLNRDGLIDLVMTVGGFGGPEAVAVLLGGAGATFGPPTGFPAGSDLSKLAVGDFNEDQKPDVAAVNGNAGTVSILLGTGTGTLLPPSAVFAGAFALDVVTRDLNGDGHLDLIVANYQEDTISVLLGLGNASFAPRTPYSVPGDPFRVAVGNFNGDSHPDLAVSGYGLFGAAPLSVLMGGANGTFGTPNTIVEVGSDYALIAADFNADGKDDIVVTGGVVHLFLNSGSGAFPSQEIVPGGRLSVGLAPGDFNQDGRLDLVVPNQASFQQTWTLTVLLGAGTSLGRPPQYFSGVLSPTAIHAADFNHDAGADFASVGECNGGYPNRCVSVLLAASDGSLSPAGTYDIGPNPGGPILSGDLNGDTHRDLIVGTTNGGVVFLGMGNGAFASPSTLTETPVAIGDFKQDGKLDLAVPTAQGFAILPGNGSGGFGAAIDTALGGPTAAPFLTGDFNEDGNVDLVVNLAIFLGDGTGHFTGAPPLPAQTVAEVVADVNNDGHADLVGRTSLDGITTLIAVSPGNGMGGFSAPTFSASQRESRSISVVDTNLDGLPDLAVSIPEPGIVAVFRGTGTAAFGTRQSFQVYTEPTLLASGDVNGDGRPDLLVKNSSFVSVLINSNCVALRLGVTNNVASCNLPATPFGKQPIVGVYDDGDNVVTCAGGTVQASILPDTGTPGATLQGTTSAGVAAGVATFSNLSVNLAGQGYVLQFSRAGVVSTRSRVFGVEAGCQGPFDFFTLTPCRVADTRDAPGIWGAPALAANGVRTFPIAGRCGIPITARSVAANVTVVNPTAAGHLTLFPAGYPVPLASTINFRAGRVRNNNAVLSLGDEGDVGVQCTMPPGPGNGTDFLIDVFGYFQ